MTNTANAYRSASLAHATHLDLLLASYDALAQDLRLAGQAAEQGQIAERCRLSGHALLLLGHLESWTPLLQEPALEDGLTSFYSFIRGELLRSQGAQTAAQFADLALVVCEVRAAWHGKAGAALTKSAPVVPLSSPEDRVAFSFSA